MCDSHLSVALLHLFCAPCNVHLYCPLSSISSSPFSAVVHSFTLCATSLVLGCHDDVLRRGVPGRKSGVHHERERERNGGRGW